MIIKIIIESEIKGAMEMHNARLLRKYVHLAKKIKADYEEHKNNLNQEELISYYESDINSRINLSVQYVYWAIEQNKTEIIPH